jgi:hypothetical protein
MSCASLPDTNFCLAATFYVWPAMLGDSVPIVKELTPLAVARFAQRKVLRRRSHPRRAIESDISQTVSRFGKTLPKIDSTPQE